MRKALIKALVELAGNDHRVVLLTGDLGYTVVEPFAEKYPDRFFNAGVAEQNMAGAAAGLAEAGFIPFIYSITPFASLRPFEFIRNGGAMQDFKIRICGVGGDFEYGMAGPTHYGLEDLGVMRLIPGMSVYAPGDFRQAEKTILSTWDDPGPVYYRLGKNDSDEVEGLEGRFERGEPVVVRHGEHALLLACGSIALETCRAAGELAGRGVETTHAVVNRISPAPEEHLAGLMARFKHVFTIEGHYATGGLGSVAAGIIARRQLPCRLHTIGVENAFDGVSGGTAYLRERHGISFQAISRAVAGMVGQ